MDAALESWVDDVMSKQQYRNGVFSNSSFLDWLRKKTFRKR